MKKNSLINRKTVRPDELEVNIFSGDLLTVIFYVPKIYFHFIHKATFIIVFGLSVIRCGDQFEPVTYFPTEKGNSWIYDGRLREIKVIDQNKIGRQQHYIIAFMDSSGEILWREIYYQRNKALYWKALETDALVIPSMSFEPPLPVAPFSNRLGQVMTLNAVEKRQVPTSESVHVSLFYEIESIEECTVPAGTFSNCVKVHMHYNYIDKNVIPYLQGHSYFWYANGVGLIKFILPSAHGELVRAKIGMMEIP